MDLLPDPPVGTFSTHRKTRNLFHLSDGLLFPYRIVEELPTTRLESQIWPAIGLAQKTVSAFAGTTKMLKTRFCKWFGIDAPIMVAARRVVETFSR